VNVSQLRDVALNTSVEAALKKALELLEEAQVALGTVGDRRYGYPADARAVRPTSTRDLSHRISAFADVARTFVLVAPNAKKEVA
jgi:hypothetical protein